MKKRVALCVLIGLITIGTGWFTSFLIGRLGGRLIAKILDSDNKEIETEETAD